jgi:succinate dehydrogenase / fumarate reductase cytochrome b subunit
MHASILSNPAVVFYHSSIGKKNVVAATAVVLVAYVVGHLVGNLQIYLGASQLNTYAALLHSMGPLLWLIRAFLLAALVLHLVAALQLAAENRAARPARYAQAKHQTSNWASRTMRASGLVVLIFIIFHLLHFTAQVTHPGFRELRDSLGRPDVYRMVIIGFQNPLVSAFYIIGILLLTAHLTHGLWSATQTFGINNRKVSRALSWGSALAAWAVAVGYVSIPASVLLGVLR